MGRGQSQPGHPADKALDADCRPQGKAEHSEAEHGQEHHAAHQHHPDAVGIVLSAACTGIDAIYVVVGRNGGVSGDGDRMSGDGGCRRHDVVAREDVHTQQATDDEHDDSDEQQQSSCAKPRSDSANEPASTAHTPRVPHRGKGYPR